MSPSAVQEKLQIAVPPNSDIFSWYRPTVLATAARVVRYGVNEISVPVMGDGGWGPKAKGYARTDQRFGSHSGVNDPAAERYSTTWAPPRPPRLMPLSPPGKSTALISNRTLSRPMAERRPG
jgi:hypothetical protein